jgi:hypothetical protein
MGQDLDIYSEDIGRFWKAFDMITHTPDTSKHVDIINEVYIEPGSDGLKDLMRVRNYTAEEYVRSIRDHRAYWVSLRPATLNLMDDAIRASTHLKMLKATYPAMEVKPIYFAMGVFRTNGTIGDDKVLIGVEMAMADTSMHTATLPDHIKDFIDRYNPIDHLPLLITHEMVHTQQSPPQENLLSTALYEGIAEFISTHATRKPSYLNAIDYGELNYEAVRDTFEFDLFIPYRRWMWMWSSRTLFGQRDLGYAVGYGMAKRYYEQRKDKTQSIMDLIRLNYDDEEAVEAIVDGSGYLSAPLDTLYKRFEASRPRVSRVSGITQGDKHVEPGKKRITIHFSEPLNGYNTGVDYGPKGKEAFPKMDLERTWSEDNMSWTVWVDLEPKRHYQILISNNFRLENGTPLKPFLIEFWTRE